MCDHLKALEHRRAGGVTPGSEGCAECLATGGRWVHLRLCMTCGHVGCCDSSPGKHATRHFHETRHPVMKSFEPGEDWAWCYLDGEYAESIQSSPAEPPSSHHA